MQVSKMTLTTGKGPTVETSLKATVGGKETDTVKEGEKIQYKLTAKNTGSEKVENLTLVGLVPEGTIYTEEVTPSTEMEGDKRDQQFNEVEDKKEVKYEGITLKGRGQYFFKIKVWNNYGEFAESQFKNFEIGLSKEDWIAKWIEADKDIVSVKEDFNMGKVFSYHSNPAMP